MLHRMLLLLMKIAEHLRGIATTALKDNEEIVESLYDRILGRTSFHDVYHPHTGELIIKAGEEIT